MSESLKPTNNNPNPTVQVTGDKQQELAKKIILDGDEQVANLKPQKILSGDDREQHSLEDSNRKNFDQKIYMFPESFNALRKELSQNWPALWQKVGWLMGNNGPQFVEVMNQELDTKVQFDSGKVDAICQEFLFVLQFSREFLKGGKL